jgi:hypothetical protein
MKKMRLNRLMDNTLLLSSGDSTPSKNKTKVSLEQLKMMQKKLFEKSTKEKRRTGRKKCRSGSKSNPQESGRGPFDSV